MSKGIPEVGGRSAKFALTLLVLVYVFNFIDRQILTILAEDIKDYKELTLETRLNGEVMQNAKLSQLIFDIPILISYVSKAMAWRAGDVLVTGTPGGVGFKRNPPIFMKPGDKVEVEVTQIGVLSNTIKDEII